MKEDLGFIRVAAAVPQVKVADVDANTDAIMALIAKAEAEKVSLLAFPELCVTGYTCADLFAQELIVRKAEEAIVRLKEFSKGRRITFVTGVPVRTRGHLYNCAAIINNGSLRGLVPKIYLPGYNEFYEPRWFSSGADFIREESGKESLMDNGKDCFAYGYGDVIQYAGGRVNICPDMIFTIGNYRFAVEICEDLWTPIPPSSFHALSGAEIILNLSASNEVLLKHSYRKSLVAQQSARTLSAYVYSSCGHGESTQDLVFAGVSLIYENGSLLAESKRFADSGTLCAADLDMDKLRSLRQKQGTFHSVSPDGKTDNDYALRYLNIVAGNCADTDFRKCLLRKIDAHPFVPGYEEKNNSGDAAAERDNRCSEIIDMQVEGLATRLAHIGAKSAVIGVSGGLDSTLALIVTALAFDRLSLPRKGITAITMPGFGTTSRTKGNAWKLMELLGTTALEIPIEKAVRQHFSDIGQDPGKTDTTYENSQARERTQILMDMANKTSGIVIGTGDLSELALGWATYNGDHMSMYAVNAGIPKTLVKFIVSWAADNCFEEAAVYYREGPGKIASEGDGSSISQVLKDIVDTPISPELTPSGPGGEILQKTEDLVGPYELHDFFLYNIFRFGYTPAKIRFLAEKAFEGQYRKDTIDKWLKTFIRRFFTQQFKRSCLPDCPKVGSVSLSPRGDWRMPSDAYYTMFLKDLDM